MIRGTSIRAGAAAALLASFACAPAETTQAGAAGTARMPAGEIVAMAMTANNGEIVTSQPAVQRAASDAVRQFAQQMITDHTAANERLQALGVAPTPAAAAQQLEASAAQTAEVLQRYEGAAFDRAYMDAQIRLHEYTQTALDNVLIPGARQATLRAELQQMRTAVAAHLTQARQIRQGL